MRSVRYYKPTCYCQESFGWIEGTKTKCCNCGEVIDVFNEPYRFAKYGHYWCSYKCYLNDFDRMRKETEWFGRGY